MKPQPIYTAENVRAPASHLRYAWSGWPSSASFPNLPADAFWKPLDESWEKDGLRRLALKWTPAMIQFTFSVTPKVTPVFFAGRVKGRLQHALRRAGVPVDFSRKLGMRTIGENHRPEVEAYISNQVANEKLVDPRFQALLQSLVVEDKNVDLSQPTESNSGRYWYNLHLVLVVRERYRIGEPENLRTIRDTCLKIAGKKGYRVSRLAVLPDHLHASLRGNIEQSPEDIALSFLNNLAFVMGQQALWQFGYYVGTFSEYDMGAVRHEA
jgi:REP element-mobilizing transposase RayT